MGDQKVNSKVINKIYYVWAMPKVGWVKSKFDFTAQGNLYPLGTRVIVRDENGVILALATRKLQSRTKNVAKEK